MPRRSETKKPRLPKRLRALFEVPDLPPLSADDMRFHQANGTLPEGMVSYETDDTTGHCTADGSVRHEKKPRR